MMSEGQGNLAYGLVRMSLELAAQESITGVFDCIVQHAVDLLDGCDAAGIMAVNSRGVETLATTHEVAVESHRIQGKLREGPCWDAANEEDTDHGRVYRLPDTIADYGRWPRFAREARELGIGSMMAFPLYTSGRDRGSLNLYSTEPGTFTHHSEQVGLLLASCAAVAIDSARKIKNLQRGLKNSRDIGTAIGIVMTRYNLSREQAFRAIAKYSMSNSVKVSDVARTIIDKRELPR